LCWACILRTHALPCVPGSQVGAIRARLETPAPPQHRLWGRPEPSERELAAVLQRVEGCLKGLSEEAVDALPPPVGLPAAPVPEPLAVAAPAAAQAPMGGRAAKGTVTPATDASQHMKSEGAAAPDWRSPAAWANVAELLSHGLDATDATVAAWLTPLLVHHRIKLKEAL
jgi:hypothetical protein